MVRYLFYNFTALSYSLLHQPNTALTGFYSGIFALYLHYHGSTRDYLKAQNICFYLLCGLYVLSLAAFVGDIIFVLCEVRNIPTMTMATFFYYPLCRSSAVHYKETHYSALVFLK